MTYEPDPEAADVRYVTSAQETLPPEGVTLEDAPAPPEPEAPAGPRAPSAAE